ncbi:MAG: histidine kinase [Crocinitomicaceae bacterium]
MERKALFYWLAQFLGWGTYFVFSIVLIYLAGSLALTFDLFLFTITSICLAAITAHGIRHLILRFSLEGTNLLKLIGITLIACILASTIVEIYQNILFPKWFGMDFYLGEDTDSEISAIEFVFAVVRSLLLFAIWSGVYIAFLFIEKSRKQEILNLKWDASKNEIELKNLRAQLNPHFLFNSLNSIRALVEIDPEQSKTAITGLSTLLRSSINLGKKKVVHLEDEMELVKNYLELEKIRFEERLKIDYKIAENSLKCEIPPLMVQTIVENAIKHGISKVIDGGVISLESNFDGKTLIISVSNPGKLDQQLADTGIGIKNTQRRLSILFGDKGVFVINQKGELVEAKIKITYA